MNLIDRMDRLLAEAEAAPEIEWSKLGPKHYGQTDHASQRFHRWMMHTRL